jgi:Tfp pilus assembly protein PilF
VGGAPTPRAPLQPRVAPRTPGAGVWRGPWWGTLLIAAIFCFVTFYAKGGLNLESMTATEMALTLASGVVVAAAVLLEPPRLRAYGLWPLGLLLAFTVLTAVSIVWSVQPDHSWQDSGRMLAYSGVFAAGVALVRLAPERWPALLGGLTLAAAIVCAYALATKVFPGTLAPSDEYARLNEPYGYWNAVGLSAAMGAICCLWLGARRSGHALLRALAYPAMGLMLLTLVLAYSRGALVALAIGVVLWFCLVPLRLRGATLLIVGAGAAGAVAAWDFSRSALSSEGVELAQRTTAGHQLGALVVAMLLALTIVGVAVGFCTGRRPPSLLARRRAGAALLAAIVLVLVAFLGALAVSHRGLTGSVSHAFNALTNPDAKPPPNTPGRLTAVASVRARYWKEALQVFSAHPLVGAGAEGYATAHLRYETDTLEVRHAHGFIVQTLADLGLVGLLAALALLGTWLAAAGRATHPFNRRWSGWRAWRRSRPGERPGWHPLQAGELAAYTPERIGLLSMLCVVVVFGAHSFIDWTWYVPGDACVALLCAGWLAARGPLAPGSRERARGGARPSHVRMLVAGAAVIAALLAAWSQWQPQRSEEARQDAYVQLEAHRAGAAFAAAKSAVSRDPLSVESLFTLATVQQVAGQPARARATLERAVRLQPSNPQPWLVLGRFDLESDPGKPEAAVKELEAAIYLNPESIAPEAIANGEREAIEVHNDYIRALQGAQQVEAQRAAALRRSSALRERALKSASERRSRAAAGGRRVGRAPVAPGSARSRSPRSAG